MLRDLEEDEEYSLVFPHSDSSALHDLVRPRLQEIRPYRLIPLNGTENQHRGRICGERPAVNKAETLFD